MSISPSPVLPNRVDQGAAPESLPRNGAQRAQPMLLIALVSALATVPVWVASYPPMADLPQHAAQIAILHNLHDPAFYFSGLFWINWFTPYLFGYMAVYAFAPLFGIATACKLVIALALLGLPLATAVLMRETEADCYWALLTIPAMYGFSYNWGFLNFLVATPLGLLFLAFVMRHSRKPTLQSSVLLGLFSVFLFFCHALIFLFFAGIAGVYVLVETGNLRKAVLLLSPIVAVFPVMVVWYLRTKSNPLAQQPIIWDLGWIHSVDPYSLGGRVTGFFPRLLGLPPVGINLFLGVPLFALPFLAGARLSKHLAVWTPLVICVIVLLFSPTTAFTGWAISHRFTVFALPFFVLALQQSHVSRPLWRAVLIVVLIAWIGVTTIRTLRFDAEAKGFNQVLSSMQPDQRALSLTFMRGTDLFPAPVFLHFPAWYSATKRGVVDMNFALWPIELIRYRGAESQPIQIGDEWNPQTFRWNRWGGSSYRYFVVHAPVDLGNQLFAWSPCAITLTAHSDHWWLYEKDLRCSTSAPE